MQLKYCQLVIIIYILRDTNEYILIHILVLNTKKLILSSPWTTESTKIIIYAIEKSFRNVESLMMSLLCMNVDNKWLIAFSIHVTCSLL